MRSVVGVKKIQVPIRASGVFDIEGKVYVYGNINLDAALYDIKNDKVTKVRSLGVWIEQTEVVNDYVILRDNSKPTRIVRIPKEIILEDREVVEGELLCSDKYAELGIVVNGKYLVLQSKGLTVIYKYEGFCEDENKVGYIPFSNYKKLVLIDNMLITIDNKGKLRIYHLDGPKYKLGREMLPNEIIRLNLPFRPIMMKQVNDKILIVPNAGRKVAVLEINELEKLDIVELLPFDDVYDITLYNDKIIVATDEELIVQNEEKIKVKSGRYLYNAANKLFLVNGYSELYEVLI